MGRKSKFSQEQKVEIYRRYLDINSKMKLELRGMPLLFQCAGHGTNSVGDKPTTGIYRQV